MEGRHPGTGEPLRRVGGRSKVAAFDLTFSAPKSVSVLFAVGDGVLAAGAGRGARGGRRCRCGVRGARGVSGASWPWWCAARGGGGVRGGRLSPSHEPRGGPAAAHPRGGREHGQRRRTAGGRRLMARRSTGTPRRPAFSIRRICAPRSVSACRGCVGGRCATGWPRSSRSPRRCCGSSPRVAGRSRSASASSSAAGVEVRRAGREAIAHDTRERKRYGVDTAPWQEVVRARAAEHGLGARELDDADPRAGTRTRGP